MNMWCVYSRYVVSANPHGTTGYHILPLLSWVKWSSQEMKAGSPWNTVWLPKRQPSYLHLGRVAVGPGSHYLYRHVDMDTRNRSCLAVLLGFIVSALEFAYTAWIIICYYPSYFWTILCMLSRAKGTEAIYIQKGWIHCFESEYNVNTNASTHLINESYWIEALLSSYCEGTRNPSVMTIITLPLYWYLWYVCQTSILPVEA